MFGVILEKEVDRMRDLVCRGDNNSAIKFSCGSCPKQQFCKRIDVLLTELSEKKHLVWEIEKIGKVNAIKKELLRLGYSFPHGIRLCELSSLGYQDLNQIIENLIAANKED